MTMTMSDYDYVYAYGQLPMYMTICLSLQFLPPAGIKQSGVKCLEQMCAVFVLKGGSLAHATISRCLHSAADLASTSPVLRVEIRKKDRPGERV